MSQPYTSIPTQAPPAYGEEPVERTEGDNVPDDFKYSVNVSLCELPVRQMFVRKVYALLMVQLLSTLAVGYLIRSNTSIQNWCLEHFSVFIISIIGSFGFMLTLFFKARLYPINLFLLAGFTICEAYGIGLACSMVESEVVIKAVLLTTIMFVGLTAFAFQTKYDFTQWQGILGISLYFLITMGFVLMFLPFLSGIEAVYSYGGALIFSVYIIVDTQIIMKSAHLEDEILSCIKLYLDVINLFMFILRILNNRDD